MPYSKKHIIEQPRPYHRLIIVSLVIAITISIQWYLHNEKSLQLQEDITGLQQQLAQLTVKYRRLLKDSPKDKSDLAIEKVTNQQLQLKLDELQEQVHDKTKDIIFYQSITQGNNSSKLQYRDLNLRVDENEPDTIRYRLVITQGKKITRPITGTISMIVNTETNGTKFKHVLDEHELNLRHVQVIEGHIKLESDVLPKTISVDLIQKNKVILSKTFDWKLAD
jgi:hypothetical protein